MRPRAGASSAIRESTRASRAADSHGEGCDAQVSSFLDSLGKTAFPWRHGGLRACARRIRGGIASFFPSLFLTAAFLTTREQKARLVAPTHGSMSGTFDPPQATRVCTRSAHAHATLYRSGLISSVDSPCRLPDGSQVIYKDGVSDFRHRLLALEPVVGIFGLMSEGRVPPRLGNL
jgi:hypothetical protein